VLDRVGGLSFVLVDVLLQVFLQQTLQLRHGVRFEVAIQPDAAVPAGLDGRAPLTAIEDRLERHEIPSQETADRSVAGGVGQVDIPAEQILLEDFVDIPQVITVERPYLRVTRHGLGIDRWRAGVQGKPDIRVPRFQEFQRLFMQVPELVHHINGFLLRSVAAGKIHSVHLVEDLGGDDGVGQATLFQLFEDSVQPLCKADEALFRSQAQ